MEEHAWAAEFAAKRLPSGMYAPLVKLSRRAGEGARESSLTYAGLYRTEEEATEAARQQYTGPAP